MSKFSFSKQESNVTVEEPNSQDTPIGELVPAPSEGLVEAQKQANAGLVDLGHNDGEVEGEILAKDIRLPRINVVQKTGGLSEEFPVGSLVYNKTFVIAAAGKAGCEVTAVWIKKLYQQKLPFGTQEAPLVFDTSAEVREAGGSLKYGDDNFFEEMAHINFVVKCPEIVTEDEHRDMFSFALGDARYGLATMTVNGSSFTSLGVALLSAKVNQLRSSGLHTGRWELTTRQRSNQFGSWYVPVPLYRGKHDEETAAFIAELSGL